MRNKKENRAKQEEKRERKKEIRCPYTNANGIQNKYTSLKIILESTDCDIIFIDETKLYANSAKPHIEGYDIIGEKRTQKITTQARNREEE